ncbi:TonB-dependent receptor [Chiayiivirga flava]|uniref:Iron complex outermembrane receptor protein n=1 Tax=Chiayiivirga flava TaxID=659595 RepID=A0A7W8D364_9GAMM|nr:TonB-dependent receptor [Chiayiivirga flava]MBB5207049.1 iron complex outermembrane receptor protein [Chiayiivirga flava]
MRNSARTSRRAPLALAILVVLAGPAMAQTATDRTHADAEELDRIEVTATPLSGDAESLAQPVDILYGVDLDRAKAGTLGDTVAKLPGVQSTFFGAGVGRPIIRGQEGPRVQVLSGGIASMDASTVSADHAVSIEPFLADQIEVLKGPATLLYGSGAIGGAVNVVDGRVPDAPADAPLSGRAELRGNTVNDEATGMVRLDGGGSRFAWHLDAFRRDADDYEIPGYALSPHEDEDHHEHEEGEEEHGDELGSYGHLANSALETEGGALGGTFFGERGFFGMAASTYRSNYGIPEGAHVHADDEHGHDHEDGDEHEHEEEGPVRIDLVQNRIDMKTGVYDPLPFLQRITLRAAHNDYEHVELEGGEPATRFTNNGIEGRLEAVQQDLDGWRGAFGLQFGDVDFGAIGEEAFVPSAATRTLGAFVLQEKDFDAFKLELGARHDRNKVAPQTDIASVTSSATSVSGAGIWRLTDALDLRFGLDRSERTPTTEELFALGAHIATGSFEIGDAALDTERANRAEIGLHVHGDRAEFSVSAYRTKFDDFIYLADTGIEEDALPVRLWTQADTIFRGLEAEADVLLADNASGAWNLRLFGDYVRARFDGSRTRSVDISIPHGDHSHDSTAELVQRGALPRIAPARVGADLRWERDGWRASLGAVRYDTQDRVAAMEEPTPGYTLVDAHLAYHWDLPRVAWEVFLDGSNLTDEEARPHTSLLKDVAPLAGRGVAFGVRAFF